MVWKVNRIGIEQVWYSEKEYKPCCYLYHNYCEEIDNCYFKRCKRLEQERDELKQENKELRQVNKDLPDIQMPYVIMYKKIKKECHELEQENKELKEENEGLKIKHQRYQECSMQLNKKYKSALEEIRTYINTLSSIDSDFPNTETYLRIQDKINEVSNDSES